VHKLSVVFEFKLKNEFDDKDKEEVRDIRRIMVIGMKKFIGYFRKRVKITMGFIERVRFLWNF